MDSTATDAAPVATWRDAVVGGAFIAGSALLLPADRRIQRAAQAGPVQHTTAFRDVADGLDVLADPGTLILAGSTYLVGIVIHERRVAALGLHVGEALVLAGAITEGLKGIAGRSRPFADPTNQYDFRFGRGFTHDQDASFPSGETTLAFAAASATTAEIARWHPGDAAFVGPLSYGLATGVALGRVYKNQHWASDVTLGAGIGTLSGLLVVRWNAAHRRNWIDRVFLPAAISSDGRHGLQVTWRFAQ
ncbi:MAG TPA: phosphatase PAP2 family protein [Gemmatimonadaceae bacterium]|nr:phosphatase PAP2 family protein [Gemmatimonadaceae bacterium]